MECQILEDALNKKIECESTKLFDLPVNEVIEILGVRRVSSIYYDEAYLVYTNHGKFHANKQMREFITENFRNMVLIGEMLVPPTKFAFVCQPKNVFNDPEYVPIVFLDYPDVRAPRIESYFLKYTGEHHPISDSLLPHALYVAIGYDAAGALFVSRCEGFAYKKGIWVDGEICRKTIGEKN